MATPEQLFPPKYVEADVHAVRAVITGNADPEQQRRAMRWIGEQCCRRLDSPYQPGLDPVDLGVLLGRQLVGIFISDMMEPSALDRARAMEAEARPAPSFDPRKPPRRERRAKL